MNQQTNVNRLQLELQTISQRMILGSELALANVDTSVIMLDYLAGFEARITARMYGKKIQVYKHPKTWLDAFKLRWFPQFLLKKYPAEWVTIETWQSYPELAIPPDRFGQPIQYFVLSNENYDKVTEYDKFKS